MSRLFLDYSIPELLAQLRSSELSLEDLARAAGDTVAELESATLAWVTFNPEALVEAARWGMRRLAAGEPLRGLEGIPFGAKDIFNTKQYPTQMGSPIWRGFTPGNNARVVDTLLLAGALLAGKTVTAEFAVHALNETLNPHGTTRTPGTSSSGSAAAVATGMVPFALASQTAGSITRPASFCGIWGMKPSFGLVPRTGVLKTTDSLDTIGFVAAHAASLRPILDEMRVAGPDYPFVYRHVDRPGPRPKAPSEPWRVGFVRTHTWEGAAPYAREAVSALVRQIAEGPDFEVTELDWPEALSGTHTVHGTIYAKSLSYYFQHEAQHTSSISPIMAEMIADGERIPLEVFRSALRQQEAMSDVIDAMFANYDFVVSLGTSSAAPLRGEVELPDPSLIWTLTHVPAVAAPAFRAPDGMPFGVQFVSRRWNDYRLLQGVEALVERGVLPAGSQAVAVEQAAAAG